MAGLAGHFAQRPRRLLRHLGVERGRSPRPPAPGRAASRSCSRPTTRTAGSRTRCCSRCGSHASPGSTRRRFAACSARRRRDRRRRAAARAEPRRAGSPTLAQPLTVRPHLPVRLDGDAAALDAPARRGRRPRPRGERGTRGTSPTSRRPTMIRDALVTAAELWSARARDRRRGRAPSRGRPARSGSSTSRTSSQ